MQKKNIAVVLMICIVCWIVGCTQSVKETSVPAESSTDINGNVFPEKYNEYLLIMSDEQRARFFTLESDFDHDRFLQTEGLEQKKYLNDHLAQGMPIQKVQELLGNPNTKEVDMYVDGKETMYIYSQFNGVHNVKSRAVFRNDKLVSWEVWTE